MSLTKMLLYVMLETKPVVLKFDLMRAPFVDLRILLLVNCGLSVFCLDGGRRGTDKDVGNVVVALASNRANAQTMSS